MAVVENGHKKDACYNEVGVCAQHIYTILGSITITLGRVRMIMYDKEIVPLISCELCTQFLFET